MAFQRLALLAGFHLLLAAGCQQEKFAVPAPDEFTRAQRERLGEVLAKAIASDPATLFLPDLPPYDTSVYDFLQALYDQATLRLHLDRKSPSDNRWNQYRPWKVHVLHDDTRMRAFCLPGGALYLTTGLLRHIESEYELYYIMTFEAMLMHQGHLLRRLAQEYNSLNLLHLIEGRLAANDLPAQVIAAELPLLIFNADVIRENDEATTREICRTSLFDPTGVVALIERAAWKQAEWLITRPSWTGRAPSIADGLFTEGLPCGQTRSLDMYEWKVLSRLP